MLARTFTSRLANNTIYNVYVTGSVVQHVRCFAEKLPKVQMKVKEDPISFNAQFASLLEKQKVEIPESVPAQVQFERSLADKYFRESQFQLERNGTSFLLKRSENNTDVDIKFEIKSELEEDQEAEELSMLDEEEALQQREDEEALDIDDEQDADDDEARNDDDDEVMDEQTRRKRKLERDRRKQARLQRAESGAKAAIAGKKPPLDDDDGIAQNQPLKFRDRILEITLAPSTAVPSPTDHVVELRCVAAQDGKLYVLEARSGARSALDTIPKIAFERLPLEVQDSMYEYLGKMAIDDRLATWAHHFVLRWRQDNRLHFVSAMKAFVARDLSKGLLNATTPTPKLHVAAPAASHQRK